MLKDELKIILEESILFLIKENNIFSDKLIKFAIMHPKLILKNKLNLT